MGGMKCSLQGILCMSLTIVAGLGTWVLLAGDSPHRAGKITGHAARNFLAAVESEKTVTTPRTEVAENEEEEPAGLPSASPAASIARPLDGIGEESHPPVPSIPPLPAQDADSQVGGEDVVPGGRVITAVAVPPTSPYLPGIHVVRTSLATPIRTAAPGSATPASVTDSAASISPFDGIPTSVPSPTATSEPVRVSTMAEDLAGSAFERQITLLRRRISSTQEAGNRTFVVLGDSQYNDVVFTQLLKRVRAFQPLFILHAGDLTHHGSVAEFEDFLGILDQEIPGIPVFGVPGNHDVRIDADPPGRIFEKEIGPRNFSIDIEPLDTTIVGLDNSLGALMNSQLAFAEEALIAGKSTRFLYTHRPPYIVAEDSVDLSFSTHDQQLIGLIGTQQPSAVFFGHLHKFIQASFGGVPLIVTGGAGGSSLKFSNAFHHFVVITRGTDGLSFEAVPLDE